MDITMKLANALAINDVLKQIIDNDQIEDISLKFRLLTIAKSFESHAMNFQMIRNQKIKVYGQEDADGNIAISVNDSASMQRFSDDMNALLDTEVTLQLSKLKPEDVINKGLSSEQLIGLYEIIEE